MLTLFAFFAPYLLAVAAFPLFLCRTPNSWGVVLGTCVLVMSTPWLVPSEAPLLRFLASISAAILSIKIVDVAIDLRQRRMLTWSEYLEFLANPFTHVRRSLVHERRPTRKENLSTLLAGAVTCAAASLLLVTFFSLSWSNVPFLLEHAGKVVALMLAIVSGLNCAAAVWRLGGGTARDYMDKPFAARTPADFWRRYNRNVYQFFWHDIFAGRRNRLVPVRTICLVFALSAALHELIFYAAVGRVHGYQAAFFAVQGLAVASTARVKVRGWQVLPWTVGTLTFNLLSSVLLFAGIHQVSPFYAHGLPEWLRQ